MNKVYTFIFLFMLCSFGLFAQNGTIRGKVTDADLGEELIGATVVIDGTTTGSTTNLDGNFNIVDVAPGTYSIKISYISYKTKIVKDIIVEAGKVAVINVKLAEEAEDLEVVVVEAKIERKAEAALLTIQKKSATIQDGISAETFSRTGDRTAAAAMQRVTGVSVEGGKYVYVRGLGDRYTKTTLNRAEIPGLDPNRNTVQMDLFPSNLIDNIIVLKTFSPDVPGSFTGGYVNINTKDFPEYFTVQAGASFTYNDQATFNSDFISGPKESGDFLGFGKGARKIPSEIDNSRNATEFSKSVFNNKMNLETRSPFLNQRYSFSLGNQSTLFGKQLGYIVALTYNKGYSYYDNGEIGRYNNPGVGATILNTITALDSKVGKEKVLFGALGNLSLQLSDKNKIGLNIIRNQSGENEGSYNSGSYNDLNVGEYRTQVLSYTQRAMTTAQLKGEHAFGAKNIILDWISSYSISTQDQPDLRFFTSGTTEDNTKSKIIEGAARVPTRYFRDMLQNNLDTKVDLTIPLKGTETKVKIGGSFLYQQRDFNEQYFAYNAPDGLEYGDSNANPSQLIGLLDKSGQEMITKTTLSNSYEATQVVGAGYALVDWRITPKLRLLTGARLEVTDLNLESDNPRRQKGILETTDLLPAFNLTYELKKDMNLRFAYGRTLARPTFRELAPYPTFEFDGDFLLLGNANLKRTLIDNVDLRWELYPGAGELITASVFFKNFQNPIAVVIVPAASGGTGEKKYDNLPNALVYGAELELRKKLGFITESLNNFMFGFNFSYIQSQIDIEESEYKDIIAIDPSRTDRTRQLVNQSPFIINTFLNFDHPEKGWKANFNFNVFGARISEIGAAGLPDVYEQPRPVLDFGLSKEFGENFQWKVSFRARNLLNPEYKYIQTFKGIDDIYRKYTVGRSFSLGVRYLID